MASMQKIVGAVIGITVSIIIIASVLAPQVAEVTGSGGALVEYKGLVSAILVLSVVGVMMLAVGLISSSRN